MQISCKKQKNKKKERKENVARQSTLGKLIGKARRGSLQYSKSTKGRYDCKDGASIETQWLMQSTAIKNRGEERERFLFEFHTEQNDLSSLPPSLLSLLLFLFSLLLGLHELGQRAKLEDLGLVNIKKEKSLILHCGPL